MKERNQVQLIGYVGADPEIKKFENGNQLAKFSVATHAPKRKQEGEEKREYSTTWHRIVAWGNDAVYAANNFIKGSRILLEGNIRYRFYDKDGVRKQSTEIVVFSLTNLDR